MKDKITSQIAALQRGIDSLTLYEGKQVKRISHIHIEKIRAVCATTKADCADYILAPSPTKAVWKPSRWQSGGISLSISKSNSPSVSVRKPPRSWRKPPKPLKPQPP